MPKILWKDLFVEIRHSLGRFFSILCIVALGVAFFAGIKASAPDMKYSADTYFDKYDTQDIQVFSTIGLRRSDIDAIRKLDGVENVQALHSMDALTRLGASELVYKIFSLPDNSTINKIRLVEGRMPENDKECLLEAPNVQNELFEGYKIGDTIKLYSGTEEPLSDSLKYDEYKVVGTCYWPRYLSYEKGTSSIGSGSVNSFIFIPEADFKTDYYTEVDVTVKGARQLNTYADAYFDVVDPVLERIESIADEQVEAQIASEQKTIDNARKELLEKMEDGQKQIKEAKEQLQSGKAELAAQENKLAGAKAQLDSGWAEYSKNKASADENLPKLDEAIAQISVQEQKIPGLQKQFEELNAQKETLSGQKAQLEEGIAQISAAAVQKEALAARLSEIKDGIAQIEAQLAAPDLPEETRQQLAAQKNVLAASQAEIENDIAQIEAQEAQLPVYESQLQELNAGLDQINGGIAQIEEGLSQLTQASAQKQQLIAQRAQLLAAYPQLTAAYDELASAQAQYDSGVQQVEAARRQLASGEQEIEASQKKLDDEVKKAKEQISEGQKKIDDLDGKWIVLDRDSLYSYRDYGACADRMDGIASVFPVFFFLVAALVCMTTMTRMVDEQRTEIGTLKALGYSKWQIAMKYLMYAFLASILGSIIGCAIGMFVFPYIIFYAWNTMYLIDQIQFEFQPGLMLAASASVTGITLLATFLSIWKELLEVPSQLMRPKAGKAGKKILLERFPAIWNRVSFLHKVTIRNIFRYKKRFLMTVIGIAGCSALLVAGFGINDSISDIVHLQYDEIYHMDASVTLDGEGNAGLSKVEKTNDVSEVFAEQNLSVELTIDDKDMSGTVHIIPDSQIGRFDQFTTLRTMKGHDPISLKNGGIYISEKMARKMELNIGDTLHFKDLDGEELSAKVLGIFENYIGHQMYVTESEFKTWKTTQTPTLTYLLQLRDTSEEAQTRLGNQLMEIPDVKSVTFYSALEENFLNMISSIRMIVVVLVISAAALAFVVLYNLSNINISERMREIATIKVLGFTEKEVNAYVNRESVILAVIGSLLGLGVGIGLHHLIMNLAELDDIMFGRTILPQSFLIAFLMTIFFALIVNFVMKFKLRKIKMVESLKAVE
ncbi:FtsX-like permease family protein [uncultured Dubosiella sp.]|uniref:FtsX-like permease family protein n=1 Tax=uncultured Dubosiella sp. TaxID=1937011 RepID=UPI0026279AEA|nr:FtsX-like permease family protein [uncultured Dubosiella sp.]